MPNRPFTFLVLAAQTVGKCNPTCTRAGLAIASQYSFGSLIPTYGGLLKVGPRGQSHKPFEPRIPNPPSASRSGKPRNQPTLVHTQATPLLP